MSKPLVTIAVPSFNQGEYLDDALISIYEQNIPVEVFVLDGGSSDNSINIIHKWEKHLNGWRSHVDKGQAAAINEGIAQGKAPYVCWLNSDDWFLPNGLIRLLEKLEKYDKAPAVYGRVWNVIQKNGKRCPVWVEPFNEYRLAVRCIISQPATLIRRRVWEDVGGLNQNLNMAMDYDLWWRLYKRAGKLLFVDDFVAVNREHLFTKTKNNRRLHYKEAISIVRKYYGRVPIKWWIYQPYAVWFKTFIK